MKHIVRVTRKPVRAQLDLGDLMAALGQILQVVGGVLITKQEQSGDPYDW